MKNTYLILLLLIIQFNTTVCLSSEQNGMYFSQLSSKDGLSHSTVISIAQDKNNIMWFATFDGLNRYDGYTFKVYRNEKENENSLMHDVLRTLFIDADGDLWIGSKGGLSQYVSEKDNFNNYQCVVNDNQTAQVNAIIEFDNSHLLLGTESGLWMFNKKQKEFVAFQQLTSFKGAVQSLAKQNNNILIGSVNGLFVYNTTRKYITSVNKVFDGKIVQAILPQSESRVWVGTEGSGLFLLNLQNGETVNYRHNPLSVMSNGADNFKNYLHNPTLEGSISQNSIRSIYMDTQGGMWLGSYYGGINYYHPLKNKFGHLQQNPYTRSLNDKVISCMIEDEEGKIWIGANDMGINIYNPQTGWFDYITRENKPSLTSNNIKAFLLSKDKMHIYVGTHGGGLLKINKQTKQAKRIHGSADQYINDVYALTYDDTGKMWVGTLSGLFYYNESSDKMIEYDIAEMGSAHVLFLKKDSQNRMWIGGEKSLGLIKFPENKLKVFKSNEYNGTIINSAVNCVFEDSKNRIWIGTRGGLTLYSESGTFSLYNKEDGLPGNMVYGILEDAFGRLWISTNEGLSCFTPESEVFKNYSETDGLKFRQYNMYSFCQSRSGLMYFGGINGITTFYPELLIDNPHNPAPGISKIIVHNMEVRPFDETGILSNNILETKRIKLLPSQSNLTIEFFVANYLAAKHNTFAYMLDGLDKTWNYATDNRQVTYNNLQRGNYVFKVKAANNDTAIIKITING